MRRKIDLATRQAAMQSRWQREQERQARYREILKPTPVFVDPESGYDVVPQQRIQLVDPLLIEAVIEVMDDGWDRNEELRRCSIFELPHRHCKASEPSRCTAESLIRSVQGYSRHRWAGHWFGETVQFLLPYCNDLSGGLPQTSARAVAEAIAEEYGFSIVKDSDLHRVFHAYSLYGAGEGHLGKDGILPVVTTSTTSYWFKHELEEYCQRKTRELEEKGRQFAESLITYGFPGSIKTEFKTCVLCGESFGDNAIITTDGYFTWENTAEGEWIKKSGHRKFFVYQVHAGTCGSILIQSVKKYQETARQALQKLEQMGVSSGKKQRVRRGRIHQKHSCDIFEGGNRI